MRLDGIYDYQGPDLRSDMDRPPGHQLGSGWHTLIAYNRGRKWVTVIDPTTLTRCRLPVQELDTARKRPDADQRQVKKILRRKARTYARLKLSYPRRAVREILELMR